MSQHVFPWYLSENKTWSWALLSKSSCYVYTVLEKKMTCLLLCLASHPHYSTVFKHQKWMPIANSRFKKCRSLSKALHPLQRDLRNRNNYLGAQQVIQSSHPGFVHSHSNTIIDMCKFSSFICSKDFFYARSTLMSSLWCLVHRGQGFIYLRCASRLEKQITSPNIPLYQKTILKWQNIHMSAGFYMKIISLDHKAEANKKEISLMNYYKWTNIMTVFRLSLFAFTKWNVMGCNEPPELLFTVLKIL